MPSLSQSFLKTEKSGKWEHTGGFRTMILYKNTSEYRAGKINEKPECFFSALGHLQ